jgi:hypothetical protein
MMLAPCAQSTAESIREVLDTRQRLKVSKWNFGDEVIKGCNDRQNVRFWPKADIDGLKAADGLGRE